MIYISYEGLNKMMENGKLAYDYAWNNYDALKNRETVHTLYGPNAYGIGACSPGGCVKSVQRKLQQKCRRKDYIRYELDGAYQILRNKSICNYNETHCTYHHFHLNGTHYACAFFKDQKLFYDGKIHAINCDRGRPVSYADISPSHMFAEFYEYLSDELVAVTVYDYFPNSAFTVSGLPASREAPYGAPDSPVQVSYFERPVWQTDFSKWFE